MLLADVADFLREHRGYLKKGDWQLARRLDIEEALAAEAKQIVKGENSTDNETEHSGRKGTHQDFASYTPYQDFLREREIDPDDVVSVKHWQNMKGEPRFSVVTKNQDEVFDRVEWKKSLLQEIRDEPLPSPSPPPHSSRRKSGPSGNLAVYHLPDMHLGKLAQGWSLDEACEKIAATLDQLIGFARLHNPDQNLFPLGHDLLQIDQEHVSRSGTLHTTTGGTPVERTDPWPVLFKRGRRLGSQMIQTLALEAPTHVQIVPGNHSGRSEFALGEVWDAQFARHGNISIRNENEYHPTYEWGKVGLLMSHGDTVCWENLPLLFATVHPELWGRTKSREILTGHKHISKARAVGSYEEMSGATLRISPSLSPQDAWHGKFGYNSLPGAEVFVYNEDHGLIAHYIRKIL